MARQGGSYRCEDIGHMVKVDEESRANPEEPVRDAAVPAGGDPGSRLADGRTSDMKADGQGLASGRDRNPAPEKTTLWPRRAGKTADAKKKEE